MRSKKPGGIILTVGIVAGLFGLALIVASIMGMIRSLKSIAVVTSGGITSVHVEKPGTLILWADEILPSSTGHSMSTTGSAAWSTSGPGKASSPPPSKASYSLTHSKTGATASFAPLGTTNMSRTYGSTKSTGLGKFKVTTPGEYLFAAEDPSGSITQFSLTAVGFGADLMGSPLIMMGGIILGGLGLALTITGIVLLATTKKNVAPPSLPPSS